MCIGTNRSLLHGPVSAVKMVSKYKVYYWMKPQCTIGMDSVLFHLEVPLWSRLCTCSIFNSILDSVLAWLHPVQLQLLSVLRTVCVSVVEKMALGCTAI